MQNVPPARPAPPSSGGGPKYAELNAAWKDLSAKAKQRMDKSPAERMALGKAMLGIPQLLQGGKLPEAKKRLDQLAAMIKIPPPPPTSAPKYADLNNRWKQLEKEAQARMADTPGSKPELTRLTAQIPDLLRSGKFPEVEKQLKALGESLKGLAAAAKEEEAVDAEWKKLEQKVKDALAKLADRKADLVRTSSGIGEMIRVGKIPLAKTLMAKVTAVLKDIQ